MKKIFFSVITVCLLQLAIQAQPTTDVPQKVLNSFKAHFGHSEMERWTKVKEALVATFKENEKWRDAYFSKDGEFKGIGKYVTLDQLPMFVQQTIANHYRYEASELYQFDCLGDGICYLALLKNTDHEMILKLDPYGNITYSQKTKVKGARIVTDIAVAKQN